MAGFLFVLWDGGGNVAPQLAIARRLVDRGHRARVLGGATLEERVRATGATFVPYARAPAGDPTRAETDLLRDWEARTPLGAFEQVGRRLLFGPARAFAQDVIEELAANPADLVVIDYMIFGGLLGAEAAGVPAALLIHTVYPAPAPGVPVYGMGMAPARGPVGRVRDLLCARISAHAFAPGFKALNGVRAELGLEPVFGFLELLDRAALALVLTSPHFDFAARAPLPAKVRYAGPVLDRDCGQQAWEEHWPAGQDGKPLVVASFSTTYMNQRPLAERVLAALGGLPVRAVLTTGPALDLGGVAVPSNVLVRSWIPHPAVLPYADLVLTHGGLGTIHAALAAGVPVVCLPCGRDQGDNAARLLAAGAGVRVSARASAPRLRRAIRAALGDPGLRAGARRMAELFAGEDGAVVACAELERVAGRSVAA